MNFLINNLSAGKSKSELLKLIAIITMAIDHIGYAGFPDQPAFRIIGRLSLPIFCYLMVQGYLHTSNVKKYAFRLFVFAVISQIPYIYYFQINQLNIFMTLVLGLVVLYAYDNKLWILLFSAIMTSVVVPMDYGIYAIFVMLLFYAFQKGLMKPLAFYLWFGLGALGACFLLLFPEQIFAVFSPLIIYATPNMNYKIKLPKYFYYAFYPVHLIILSFIFR